MPERDLLSLAKDVLAALALLEAQALTETENRTLLHTYQGAIGTSEDVFLWSVDSDLRFILTTDAIAKVFGEPVARMVGRYFFDLRSFRDRDCSIIRLHCLMEAHLPFREALLPVTDRSGRTREVLFSGEPWFDTKGEFGGYRGVAIDLTCPETRSDRAEQPREDSVAWLRPQSPNPTKPNGIKLRLVHSERDPETI
jgi:hypothetical protein